MNRALLPLSLRCLGLLLACSLCGAGATAAAAERPNILLVLSDDHSVPHLGSYDGSNAITLECFFFAA